MKTLNSIIATAGWILSLSSQAALPPHYPGTPFDDANAFKFSIHHQPASECRFPVRTGSTHKWNTAEVGTITFPEASRQLLTLHCNQGNNFAYFDFELVPETK